MDERVARRELTRRSSRFEFTPGLIDAIVGLLLGDPFGEFGEPAKNPASAKPDLLLGFAEAAKQCLISPARVCP